MELLNFYMMMGGKDQNPWMSMLPLLLIVVVFYFFMIRPQSKKAKTLKKFREGIQKGDRIVTIGGIHGKVCGVKDNTIVIESEGGTKLKVERSAVSQEFTSGASNGEANLTDKVGGGR